MNNYSGNNKPYIYVSFAEENEEQVMPVLEKLCEEQVLFWCGGPVNFREKKRIEGAHAVLLFVSQTHSKNADFRKTVDEAVRCNKNILTIYLEDVQMDSWGHMQLDSAQALFIGRFPDEEAFTARLKEAEIFRNMQVTEQQKRFKRNTTLTAVLTPLTVAAIVFALIIYPRFFTVQEQPEEIVVEQKENAIFKGLTQEELDKIEFLTILGNKIYTKSDTGLQIFDNGDGTERYKIDFEDGTHDEGILERGGISDFEDIKQLRNVHFLKVLYNDIANIEDIAEIKDLISLELTGNPISDLTGVEKLKNLEFIRIDHTNVKDLSPLHKTNLKGISMKFTGATEIDPDFARQLSEFQCEGCNITEIPKLGPYEHAVLDIHRLNLKSNDASFLEDVKSFDVFNVDGFSAETLKPYLQGKPIYKLIAVASMNPTSLTELEFLNMMPGSELGLDNSDRLLSLEGAEHFEGIESICLQHCDQVEDFTPLLKIKSLKHVAVSSPMLEKVERDLGESNIEIEVRDVW